MMRAFARQTVTTGREPVPPSYSELIRTVGARYGEDVFGGQGASLKKKG